MEESRKEKLNTQQQQLVIEWDELNFENANHLAGLKKVAFNKTQSETSLTQFAFGKLEKNTSTELHQHETMEEYFYFTEGSGQVVIEKIVYPVKKGSFARIPSKALHKVSAGERDSLEFVYFGIALD